MKEKKEQIHSAAQPDAVMVLYPVPNLQKKDRSVTEPDGFESLLLNCASVFARGCVRG